MSAPARIAGILVVVMAMACSGAEGSDCGGYYSPQHGICFPKADDTGRPCRDTDECEYWCDCPQDKDADVGVCSPYPYEQYCALVNGDRELRMY